MKIGFVTCVKLGLSCIEAILKSGDKFELFITLQDHLSVNKSGRIYLDETSKKYKIPLYKINHINSPEVLDIIQKHELDWLFIIGWSQIANTSIINAPKNGVIGAHPTLLPIGRGRAAIPWTIIKGLKKTGVTFFKLNEGVDTGDIIDQFEIMLDPQITASQLYILVDHVHIELMKRVWYNIHNRLLQLKPQDNNKATYWIARKPIDGELHTSMLVEDVDKLVRATTKPYPGAYIIYKQKKLIIWKGEIGLHTNGINLHFLNGSYTVIDFEMI